MNDNNRPSSTPIVSGSGPVMIVGSTGFIGRFLTKACIDSGRLTYLLVRPSLASPSKVAIVNSFQEKGATIIHGSITDPDFMMKVLREYSIEVVISAVGGGCIIDQLVLVQAIQAAGTVKRFLPSEFGHDIDRADPVEPGLAMYNGKREVRKAIEKAGIPYTYICCNSIASWPYHDNTHPSDVLPPLDQFQIYGDGSIKAYFVAGSDIGKFTVKAMDDVRTLNKTLHFRPPNNLVNMNDLASLWEKKIGRSIPRVTITEDDLLDAAREMRIPQSVVAALTHDIFIKGCQINYSLDKPNDVEVCSLYPDTPFTSIDECFSDYVGKIVENQKLVNKQQQQQQPGNNNNNNNNNKNGIIIPNSKQEGLAIATCS